MRRACHGLRLSLTKYAFNHRQTLMGPDQGGWLCCDLCAEPCGSPSTVWLRGGFIESQYITV